LSLVRSPTDHRKKKKREINLFSSRVRFFHSRQRARTSTIVAGTASALLTDSSVPVCLRFVARRARSVSSIPAADSTDSDRFPQRLLR
jgi:hypothetical protein